MQEPVQRDTARVSAEILWTQAGRDIHILFGSAPEFAGREYASASIAVTGEPVPDLNMAVVWSSLNSNEAISEYASLLRARRVPGLLLMRGSANPSLLTCAEAAGFAPAATLPLMIRHARALPTRLPKGTVERVETVEQLCSINTLISQAFEIPLESAQRAFSPALLEDPSFVAFGLVRDGASACSLHSTRQGTSVGLWSLGTPPETQRKGFGRDALVGAMEWHAARGAESFYLISTPAGQHLYQQIGFEVYEEVSVFQANP